MNLEDRIGSIDPIQARRYGRLFPAARAIAQAGIIRHFDACDRHGVEPDRSAIREIIDDALEGRAVYAETDQIARRNA